MKNIIKFIYMALLFIPIFINARVNYDEGKSYANHYIYNFTKHKDYIYLGDDVPYIYENGILMSSKDFTSAGFLSKSEYEISNVNGNTYLANGLEYWTLTQSSNKKHYIIHYKLEEMLDSELSGVRLTEYAKHDNIVYGKGSYSDPWVFADVLSINIGSTNIKRGGVSNFGCEASNIKNMITLSVVGGVEKEFYICPSEGFRIYKNSCSGYITHDVNANKYFVSNLDKDNLVCNISFTFITKKVTINGCSSCSQGQNYSPLYVSNLHEKWFTDSDGMNETDELTPLPIKTGYTFRGFYTSQTDHFDSNKIIDSTGKLLFNNVLNNNVTVYPWMEANQYTVTFNANGGGGLSSTSLLVTYDQRYDNHGTLPTVTKPGYKFEGWYTALSGGTKVTGSTIVKITDNQTLYARWTQCAAGTYSSEDSTQCIQCSAGKYSLAGASSCSICPSGYTSTAGSTAQDKCYISVSAGKYIATANSATQTSCSVGTYKVAHNVYYGKTSSCSTCPSGYTSDEGATAQNKCYVNVSAGKYIATANSATQSTCSAGTYKVAHKVYYGNKSSCTNCPTGYTSAEGATAQSKCYISVAAGKYISVSGASTPTSCGTGTYNGAHTVYYGNKSSCTDCPGSYTSATGASVQTDCYLNVSGGKYLGTAKSSTTTTCVAGKYKAAHKVYYGNTSSCSSCGTGKYSAAGASSCSTCPSGYTSVAESDAIGDCYLTTKAGKYLATANSSTQITCTANYYCKSTKVYYGNTGGRTSCPSGYGTSAAGSDAASDCYLTTTAGKYIATANSSTQSTCTAGYYCPSSKVYYGQTGKITSCGAGYTSPAGSDASNDCKSSSSLPIFAYTGKYELVKDDDTLIVSGNNSKVTIPDSYKSYTGNWKIRLLTTGKITFYSYGKGTNIDIFLVGGGGNGVRGNIEDGCYSANRFCCNGGSGGKGGACLTKNNISFSLNTGYNITIGGAATASSIAISGSTYSAAGAAGASGGYGISGYSDDGGTGAAGCLEFNSSSYSKRYGGGGGGAAGSYSSDGRTGSGGAGGSGGGGRGGNSSYWSGYGSNGSNGTANTGGGGGGGGADQDEVYYAGSGGSGIVIIRNVR